VPVVIAPAPGRALCRRRATAAEGEC